MSNNILDTIEINLSNVGPKGGNLEDPRKNFQGRRNSFTPLDTSDPEVLGLHNPSWQDTAVDGWEKEQGWHRMAAYMILEGKDNELIATAAQVHVATISKLRAQKWFQELLAKLAQDDHQMVQGAIQGHALAAVEKLAEKMENSESDRVQVTCALALLEHAHGKAVQRIHSVHEKGASFSSPQEERNALLQQLQDLRNARQSRASSSVVESATEEPIG